MGSYDISNSKRRGPRWSDEELTFNTRKMPREMLERMLVVCGKVGSEKARAYEAKAKELGCDFVSETRGSWVFTQKTLREIYDPSLHLGVLLIGDNKELPATRISHQKAYAFTDWFLQDIDGDGIPDAPVGRVFGPMDVVLYHMDPNIIDSDVAIVFDSEPGRSNRHVEALTRLGFNVQVLRRYRPEHSKILSVCEFILQFSDGVLTSRIHGTPDRWATHNGLILSHKQVSTIDFEGYPVIYSEACNTAQEGPLLKAFLNKGAVYIGATLDTMNNLEPFDDWRTCPYCDGWKFGFLDLLDSHDTVGQVKVAVDRELATNLNSAVLTEIDQVRNGTSNDLTTEHAVSVVEWVLYGNPLRSSVHGPDADFSPGRLIVDT
ncbi:MAG: hypothetical protein ACP6KW_08920 [Candidatus Thorarchaeota archaeon]